MIESFGFAGFSIHVVLHQPNTWSRPLRGRPTSRGRAPKVPARILVQSDPAAQGRQASGAVPNERHTSEAQVHCRQPRGAQTRPARASPSSAASLRKWLHHSPRTLVQIPQRGHAHSPRSAPFEQPRVRGPLRAGTVGPHPLRLANPGVVDYGDAALLSIIEN